MPPSSVVIFRTVDPASPEAQWAMERYFEELNQRFANGFDRAAALGEALTSFRPPEGLFVVATIEGVVGCGALQWLDPATAEIKRMWVDPDRRGIGLGKQVLRHLEELARSAGRSRVVLDTNESLGEAIAMYRALGYTPIARYNDNPYAHHWFEKVFTG